MKTNAASGKGLVFAGAACWSLSSPLVKLLSVDAFLICALRAAIAAVALAFFFRPKKLNWNRWMALYLFCYAGLCMAAILSLSMTAAPISVGMQYTAIVWLFAASEATPLVILALISTLLPTLASFVRRLRDTDVSPWLVLAVPILPFLLLVPSVVLTTPVMEFILVNVTDPLSLTVRVSNSTSSAAPAWKTTSAVMAAVGSAVIASSTL